MSTLEDVSISVAPSNRASCQRCKEKIDKGTMRVTFPGRHNGITVAKSLKPACFAEHCIIVDYAPTDRAKCAGDGRQLVKGQPRLVMRLINCEGKVSSQKLFFPCSEVARAFVDELLSLPECTHVTHASIAASLDGPSEDVQWVADALQGRVLDGRAVPQQPQQAKEKKKKKGKGEQPPDEGGGAAADAGGSAGVADAGGSAGVADAAGSGAAVAKTKKRAPTKRTPPPSASGGKTMSESGGKTSAYFPATKKRKQEEAAAAAEQEDEDEEAELVD